VAGQDELLHVDIACVSCGYRLLGEPLSGRCPVCDTPIEKTVRRGSLLLASIDYLTTARNGLRVVQVGMFLQIAIFYVATGIKGVAVKTPFSLPPAVFEVVLAVSGVIAALVTAHGWWMFTEPRDGSKLAPGRRVVRSAVFAHAVFTGVTLLGQWLIVLPAVAQWQGPMQVVIVLSSFAAVVTLCVQHFAVMTFMGHASKELRDSALARIVRGRTWAIALWATVGMLVCLVGPLVAVLLYVDTAERVRARLRQLIEAHVTADLALQFDEVEDQPPTA